MIIEKYLAKPNVLPRTVLSGNSLAHSPVVVVFLLNPQQLIQKYKDLPSLLGLCGQEQRIIINQLRYLLSI